MPLAAVDISRFPAQRRLQAQRKLQLHWGHTRTGWKKKKSGEKNGLSRRKAKASLCWAPLSATMTISNRAEHDRLLQRSPRLHDTQVVGPPGTRSHRARKIVVPQPWLTHTSAPSMASRFDMVIYGVTLWGGRRTLVSLCRAMASRKGG